MKYTTLDDGSLLYEGPITLRNKYYKADPDNPCRIIPIFPQCTKRVLSLRVLSCGNKRGQYNCEKFGGKIVTMQDCEACDAPEPG